MSLAATTPASGTVHSLRTAIRAVGFAGLGILAVTVSLTDVIARAPADTTDVGPQLAPPSGAFPFGTDLLGRDMLSETIHGLAVTLGNGVIAMLATLLVGGLLGFVAARLPWRSGYGLRFVAGILSAVPVLLLAILFVGVAGRGQLALAAGMAAAPAAFARAFDRARSMAATTHARYAHASGIREATLLRRDLAYEFRDTFLSTAARALAAVTIVIATMSFLGFGAVPPARDLGLVIAAARSSYLAGWWVAAFPALALLLVVLCARLAAALEEGERP